MPGAAEKEVLPTPFLASQEDAQKDNETQRKEYHNAGNSHEYVKGVKLFSLMVSVTLVSFLMLLDMSIIVTVQYHP